MTIHHLAIWTKDLEQMKTFYVKFFNCQAGKKYHNREKGFTACFLSFENGAKIELMHKNIIKENNSSEIIGLAHFAISTGNKDNVDKLTKIIENEGYIIKTAPRKTGDGYYESVILDPENNLVEITV